MKSSACGENTESALKNLADDMTIKLDTLNNTMRNALDCILNGLSSIEKSNSVKVNSTADQSAESHVDQNVPSHNQYRQRQSIHIDSTHDKCASENLDSNSMKGSYIPVISSKRPRVNKD